MSRTNTLPVAAAPRPAPSATATGLPAKPARRPVVLSPLACAVFAVFVCLLVATPVSSAAAPAPSSGSAKDDLVSLAERSHFQRTGRYDETIALCQRFATHYPDAVSCQSFGITPEGRPMQVLVVSRSGARDAAEARTRGLPVVLVQGGIHAGEIDGKDAGFLALRQALDGDAAPGALEKLVLLFVPVFNVDGHERFGRWNRPNQRGPEEMGWRTTAQNYNLNRDYMKADAPEMQAMLRLIEHWDPLATIDLHVTDGAKFEHDISIQVEPVYSGDEALRGVGLALRGAVTQALARQGSLPLAFYPSFEVGDDPQSGFADGVPPPRFSHGYFPLRNRLGMLVETHSWKDYPTRVRITRNAVVAVLEQIAEHGRTWRALATAADARSAALAGKPVALEFTATQKSREIEFCGYAYTRTDSEISGATMTRYDETRPQRWKLKLRDEVLPSLTIDAPGFGYLVPAAQADAAARSLSMHGIQFERLAAALENVPFQSFQARDIEFAATSVEGHQRVTLAGEWSGGAGRFEAGSLLVPIAQSKARLVMALLEPTAADSLAAWGIFNNHFEPKEYMEPYVAEDVAREMLDGDPALKKEFEELIRTDKKFADDPQARLDFFYRRHTSWDTRYGLYPIVRLDRKPDDR